MKKTQLLNASVSRIVAEMGHTDGLCIADAGLPIPVSTDFPARIDLAVSPGVPSFLEVLRAVLSEIVVERVLMAEEIKTMNPSMWEAVYKLLKPELSAEAAGGCIEYLSHEKFKKRTHETRAVLRTGECSPYSNIILYSGVAF